jgi:putative copper resistance protein D
MNGFEYGAGDWLIAVRAIHFAASAMIAGILLFRIAVAEPALRSARPTANLVETKTLRLAWISLGISLVSAIAWITLQAPAMSGLSFSEAMTAEVIGTVLTETQFGLLSEIRLVLAMMVAACLAYDPYPTARWLGLATSLCVIAAIAATGHAGSTEGAAGLVHLVADAMHLVASAAWIGGVLALVLLITATRRANPDTWPSLVHDATARFSIVAMLSVSALLVTGIVSGVILVGSLRALLVTRYGQLLMFKMALFAVMLGFAAVNKFRLTPRLAGLPNGARELDAVRRLTRNCNIEIALGLSIFAIVGMLGTIHPAIHLVPL